MDEDDHDILIEVRNDLRHLVKWASSRPCLAHDKDLVILKSDRKWVAAMIGTIIAIATAIGAFFR